MCYHGTLTTHPPPPKSRQLCPTLCDPKDGGPPGSRPWDFPCKHTGVGCHFLLQCRKVKSESEVAQSCLTLSHPMDCSLPGYSVHGIFQGRVLEWVAIAFSVCTHSSAEMDLCQRHNDSYFTKVNGHFIFHFSRPSVGI